MSQTLSDSLLQKDTAVLRRRLASMHGDLRARGYNPLEALRELADTLFNNDNALANPSDELTLDYAIDVPSLAWTAFQEFLTTDLRAAFGQYLTPLDVARHVTDLLGQLSPGLRVADPFLGSGILLDAVANRNPGISLFGYEINDCVAHVGKSALHLAGHSVRAEIADSFEVWANSQFEKVDAIVTNPPFGANLVTFDQPELCNQLSLPLSALPKAPVELLAMELCMDRLTSDGVLIIVLPNSVLTNRRFNNFRADFFSRYTLEHVTQLAATTFAPFRGVARASVLVIRKDVPANLPYTFTQEVSESAGYDATGRPQGTSDLQDIIRRIRHGQARQATISPGGEIHGENDTSARREGFRLGEIADIFRGKNPARDEYYKTGPFLLKVGSLSGSFISWRDRERSRISREFFQSSPTKQLRPNDICFTGTAHTPKYICQKVNLITDLPPEGAMPSGEVVVVRLRQNAPISPLALLYYLRSEEGRRDVQRLIKGSTAHVYPKDLVRLMVPDLAASLDMATVEKLHREAEASFRSYLLAEDEISKLLELQTCAEETDD